MGIIYKKLTGAIVETFSCPPGYESDQHKDDEEWSGDNVNPLTNFVDVTDPELPVLPRVAVPYSLDKSTITADGLDFATISGIPASLAELFVEDPDGVRSAIVGDIEFVADVPGDYILRLSSGIHLTTEITITATAVT